MLNRRPWRVRSAGRRGALLGLLGLLGLLALAGLRPAGAADAPHTMSELLAASKPSDWRALDPENTVYLELPGGRVVIELAAAFAPLHAANIKTLVRESYFDGLSINRVQDNFVVQWGDADTAQPRPLKAAAARLAPEFTVKAFTVPFTRLADSDGYAAQVGFSDGMPAGRDLRSGEAWLAHCYGMVGAGRGNEPDSGNGAELYVVIGHSPRQLDRNIALVGRVVHGIERLSVLPRGDGPMGFYERPAQRVPIKAMHLAADLPAAQRTPLEILRTDTSTFGALVELRRNRRDEWYRRPAGFIDLCNVPLPVRAAAAAR